MKTVILDGYTNNPGDLSWDQLETITKDLTVHDSTPQEEAAVVETIGDAEAVLVNKILMTREIMQKCPNLRYIGVLATGYNNVDLGGAEQLGITVTNIPAYGTPAVAQHTFALLLELCSRVGHHSEAVKQGRWITSPNFCFWDYPLTELYGKAMGLVGFGQIGQKVAQIAGAFGMEVIAYSPTLKKDHPLAKAVSLETLFKQSDMISLHCPLSPKTKEMINKDTIGQMKHGVRIINTARGGLIHQQDLADALNNKKVGGAGLDVVDQEPMSPDNPLLTAKNCVITPHIAWATKESRQRLIAVAAENLKDFMAGTAKNVVHK